MHRYSTWVQKRVCNHQGSNSWPRAWHSLLITRVKCDTTQLFRYPWLYSDFKIPPPTIPISIFHFSFDKSVTHFLGWLSEMESNVDNLEFQVERGHEELEEKLPAALNEIKVRSLKLSLCCETTPFFFFTWHDRWIFINLFPSLHSSVKSTWLSTRPP